MPPHAGNLCHRLKEELSIRKVRVRNFKVGGVNHLRVNGDYIYVDYSVGVASVGFPVRHRGDGALYGLELLEHFLRLQIRPERDAHVEKRMCRLESPGLGFHYMAHLELPEFSSHCPHGAAEVEPAVAEVGSYVNEYCRHFLLLVAPQTACQAGAMIK